PAGHPALRRQRPGGDQRQDPARRRAGGRRAPAGHRQPLRAGRTPGAAHHPAPSFTSFSGPYHAMILSFAPRLALLGLLVLVSACQSFPDGERRVAGEMDRSLAESLDHSQTVLDTPLPSASSRTPVEPPPAPNAPGADAPRFDVLVSDMPARAFFLSLMDSAGQNILVHPQVSGDISLSLRQVTLPDVLAAVRDSYGYDYRRTRYGYQIQPNQAITRT